MARVVATVRGEPPSHDGKPATRPAKRCSEDQRSGELSDGPRADRGVPFRAGSTRPVAPGGRHKVACSEGMPSGLGYGGVAG